MDSITDQAGRTIAYYSPLKRIVSLVPSQTELLAHLGLNDAVVGITKFCVHPKQWWRTKCRIGGTKNVDVAKVLGLKPDLVLANKEENVQDQVTSIAQFVPTYVSQVNNLQDALEMMRDVGRLTGKQQQANELAGQVEVNFKNSKHQTVPLKAAYLIWQNPLMSVGGDTFIHDMLRHAGFENVLAHKTRYPATDIYELQQLDPGVLLLSSEPFPFKEKHVSLLQPYFPNASILLVNGEMFSWYGSRMLQAPSYFTQLRQSIA